MMAAKQTISIVIADDHPIVLHGLMALLKSEPDFRVVAACNDGEEAFDAILTNDPDVALLDFRMPKLNGMEVLAKADETGLRTRVIFLTAIATDGQVLASLNRRAYGIVLKESAAETVASCIREVAAGRRWVPEEALRRLMEGTATELIKTAPVLKTLTLRERNVLQCLVEGQSNKEIARSLGLSDGTVKVHLHNIYEKTGANNRTSLVALVLRLSAG
ncbi:MAG: response regulator transcription factor [Gammaproteobacteria bacterium]|nr:response regulator transcription factor [Gammaproteobacteria bacterium]